MIAQTRLFTPGAPPLSPVVRVGHQFTPDASIAAANAEYLKRA